MTDLTLREWVEKATGPERGLDGLIARDVLGWIPYFGLEGDALVDWPMMGGHWHQPGDLCGHWHDVSKAKYPDPPEYTASIDAAITLYLVKPDRIPSDPLKVILEALDQRL